MIGYKNGFLGSLPPLAGAPMQEGTWNTKPQFPQLLCCWKFLGFILFIFNWKVVLLLPMDLNNLLTTILTGHPFKNEKKTLWSKRYFDLLGLQRTIRCSTTKKGPLKVSSNLSHFWLSLGMKYFSLQQ